MATANKTPPIFCRVKSQETITMVYLCVPCTWSIVINYRQDVQSNRSNARSVKRVVVLVVTGLLDLLVPWVGRMFAMGHIHRSWTVSTLCNDSEHAKSLIRPINKNHSQFRLRLGRHPVQSDCVPDCGSLDGARLVKVCLHPSVKPAADDCV